VTDALHVDYEAAKARAKERWHRDLQEARERYDRALVEAADEYERQRREQAVR
jgi:hypothetical protein